MIEITEKKKDNPDICAKTDLYSRFQSIPSQSKSMN